MSTRHGPPQRHGLPTLTEVIELAPLGDAGAALPSRPTAAPSAAVWPDTEQLIERLLGDLQRDANLTLELRLREALAPVLARVADDLVRELRDKLHVTLREVVTQAASQELARRRVG